MAIIDLLGRQSNNVIVGGSEVFLTQWTTGGTANATTFSAGYTRGDAVLTPNYEVTDIDCEQSVSPILTFISGSKMQLEFELLQNDLQNMRLAMAIASSTTPITGTAPGTKLALNEPSLEYLQMKFVAPGSGTTHVDTYYFWRCLVRANGGIPFGKKTAQAIKCIAAIFADSTSDTTKGVYGARNVA